MAIHVTMNADQLGRSRFVISPAQEVVSAVRHRHGHRARHAARWYARARADMEPALLTALEALVPTDHVYAFDFLTPTPTRSVESIEDLARRIKTTPSADIERQLDIALRERPIRPDVAVLFGDVTTYERWRRPTPHVLKPVIADGPEAVAFTASNAILAFFTVAISPDWDDTLSLLQEDVRRKGDLLAHHGATAMLDALGPGMSWTGSEVQLERPYDVVLDWADDGMLFVPTTTHVGPVQFTSECPTPAVVYRADGVARLSGHRRPDPSDGLADVVGGTRAALLVALSEPRATNELSRQLGWSDATVSYHLQVLLRADLVDRHRRGRKVFYRRTARADVLLDS
jgi:DNA-binding transcriptional ArsR family regulator